MGYQDEVTKRVGDALRSASEQFPHLTEYPTGRFLGAVIQLCLTTKDVSADEMAWILELQAKLLREGTR